MESASTRRERIIAYRRYTGDRLAISNASPWQVNPATGIKFKDERPWRANMVTVAVRDAQGAGGSPKKFVSPPLSATQLHKLREYCLVQSSKRSDARFEPGTSAGGGLWEGGGMLRQGGRARGRGGRLQGGKVGGKGAAGTQGPRPVSGEEEQRVGQGGGANGMIICGGEERERVRAEADGETSPMCSAGKGQDQHRHEEDLWSAAASTDGAEKDEPNSPEKDADLLGAAHAVPDGEGVEEILQNEGGSEDAVDNDDRRVSEDDDDEVPGCDVCMQPLFSDPHREVVALPCGGRHQFHWACIVPWFEKCSICPKCRGELSFEACEPSKCRHVVRKSVRATAEMRGPLKLASSSFR
eukprot:gnl/TRDRNA2_/TRDRNA2_64221_c0_seq1.p1 gnl/TRDRNA2_/TRDRNA2_64221_c0~~gnl/TRDRNA2_/TRDRNA2_64221_c0_seq1.p1  ORF type:complete len:355 (+),score=53.83 gnl/TRDRNA2_/TRDRNA2_64221_c0_seq1:62-1126(+)